jgi:putative PIN family toxin of toxin-antitoxin system
MRSKERIKIVVDTNLWISFLMSLPFEQRLRRLLLSDEIVFLFSAALFDELETTAKKRKFHRYFDASHVDDLLQMLVEIAEIVEVHSLVEVCRDPKDNFLLALAKDGGADYLITVDRDLLTLNKSGKTKIVTLKEFEKEWNK